MVGAYEGLGGHQMIRMDNTDLIDEGAAYEPDPTSVDGEYETDLIGWLTEALQAATAQSAHDMALLARLQATVEAVRVEAQIMAADSDEWFGPSPREVRNQDGKIILETLSEGTK